MLKKISLFIQNLWEKRRLCERMTVFERIIFAVLRFFELLYKAGFFFVCRLKKKKTRSISSFKVISIGNLSLGGTGKSVVTQFLIQALAPKKGAVVMRGYKGSCAQTKKSFLVSDGSRMLCNVLQSGDEAYMAAQHVKAPVVVGRDRYSSCRLLEQQKKDLDFVVFDDAYQNFSVKKDYEILLLDARKPFENGYCLPAGRLRERDVSRADAIILTHADCIDQKELRVLKQEKLASFNQSNIFFGRHASKGLVCAQTGVPIEKCSGKELFAFAGIGTWSNFDRSLRNLNDVVVKEKKQYQNHHDYSFEDVKSIIQKIQKNNLDGAITTHKDWVKINYLLKNLNTTFKKKFYVLQVAFEFLSQQEYHAFMKFLKRIF